MAPVRTVAVTGAGGFVGRHVLAALAGRGIEIVAFSRSPKLRPPIDGGRWMELDIHLPSEEAIDAVARADVLLHLAWDGLPNHRSLHHFERELPRHYVFLKRAVEHGLNSMVVAGTALEYGMRSGALDEAVPARPCTAYGLAKDALRRQLDFLRASRGFSFCWARMFELYGEGQHAKSLWSQFQHAARRAEISFDVPGADQVRDAMAVERAARILASLALARPDCGAVNLCSGRPVSVRTMVEEWASAVGWRGTLAPARATTPEDEPFAYWGVATRLNALVGPD